MEPLENGMVPLDMFPDFTSWDTVQGGKTVKTYQMPPWAQRCQYSLKTNGRPLRATVQTWLGPLRNTHTLNIDIENGATHPYQATLKFKGDPNIRISTSKDLELPVQCSVYIPPPERALELEKNTEKVWSNATPFQKQLVQGGCTTGGGGSIRTWNVPDDVNQVQIVSWSRDVGAKSFRAYIEISQGPNNPKQKLKLQCGGGSQPYHGVFQTPGPGWIIRLTNDKFVEDGLFQFAVVPYDVPLALDNPQLANTRSWWS